MHFYKPFKENLRNQKMITEKLYRHSSKLNEKLETCFYMLKSNVSHFFSLHSAQSSTVNVLMHEGHSEGIRWRSSWLLQLLGGKADNWVCVRSVYLQSSKLSHSPAPKGLNNYMITSSRNQHYYHINSQQFDRKRIPPPPPRPAHHTFSSAMVLFFSRLRDHYWHRLSWGKRIVRLEMISCLSLLPCLQPFYIIVMLRSDVLICMVAAPLPACGWEIEPQQGAKCAFSLNNPFNLSSITGKQLRALILLQSEAKWLQIDEREACTDTSPRRKVVMEGNFSLANCFSKNWRQINKQIESYISFDVIVRI